MNNSGLAVARAVRYTGVEFADVLVVVDEVHLPLGRLRLRGNGSAGGHNGLKSIIAHTGSQEFPRLRLGVGAVLSAFSVAERPEVDAMVERAADAVMAFVTDGLERAMNAFN